MMLNLFLVFLKIGAVSFGGGYGMIALIREEVLSNGWLTESEFLSFIAVSESTPGPLAVNIATFIGSAQGGILGAFLATLGVVTPAFLVILIIAAVLNNAVKYTGTQALLGGIRPTTAALVTATGAILLMQTLFCFTTVTGGLSPDGKSILILLAITAIGATYKTLTKKNFPPILMILVSALLGILVFS